MDIARVAVLIWIVLPIALYLISWRRHALWLRNFPSAATATIVEVADGLPRSADVQYSYTTAKYSFNAGETEHTGKITLAGQHKPGEEILLRYDPARPDEGVRDTYPTNLGWAVMGLLLLAFDLGIVVFFVSGGLISVAAAVYGYLRRPPWWPTWQELIIYGCSASLVILFILAANLAPLIALGFWRQNVLWLLWNL